MMRKGDRARAKRLAPYEIAADRPKSRVGNRNRSIPLQRSGTSSCCRRRESRRSLSRTPWSEHRSSFHIARRSALSPPEPLAHQTGVKNVRELRKKPLTECDRLAKQAGLAAEAIATAEGAVTGLGGRGRPCSMYLFYSSRALRSIVRTSQCYGYPADEPNDRYFNLGILTIATAGSLATRLERLDQLQDLEKLLVEEIQVDIIRSELLSFLFQLEVFEEIPGIGVASGPC